MENKNLTDELVARADKVKRLQSQGELAYKAKFKRTHKIIEIASLPLGSSVRVAGRVVLQRNFGKLVFAQLYDIEQTRQISLSVADIGKEQFDKFIEFVDIGDFIGVEGKLYNTQKGELTVQVSSWTLLGKALRGLPEKFHGLTDTEARFRQKYLDFISNKQSREYILARFKLLAFLREFYKEHGFLEIETPILQNAVTGAMAKPFETFHNALDMKMNLRISPEISLKTALAAGFDKVFEVAKNFRNEGLTTDKLQEFTMIESYAAYWDFEDSIEFYSKLFRECVKFLFGEYKFTINGHVFDVSKPFKRLNYTKELSRIVGFDILTKTDPTEFGKELIAKKLLTKEDLKEVKTTGGMIDLLYKRIMRPSIIEPTILYSYPNLIPLVRFNDEDPRLIDMFQLVISGRELVKGYSELVNPEQQKKNFEAQLAAKKAGDGEAMDFDKNYLLCMEHGIPPCSGIGFGIDVFLMTLMDIDNIRDTLLFPLVKPAPSKSNVAANLVKDALLFPLQQVKDVFLMKLMAINSIKDVLLSPLNPAPIQQEKPDVEKMQQNIKTEGAKIDSKADHKATLEKAKKTLSKYMKKPNLIAHSEAVAKAMRHFAKINGENENYWEAVGLLHDVDYELYPDKHCIACVDMLKKEKYDEGFIRSIQSHNSEGSSVLPSCFMENVLAIVDRLSGFLTACALIRPDKDIKLVEMPSVKKKWANQAFAAATNRKQLEEESQALSKTIDYMLEQTLIAMQGS